MRDENDKIPDEILTLVLAEQEKENIAHDMMSEVIDAPETTEPTDYDKDDLRPYRWYGFLIPPPGKWRGFLIESLSFMSYDKMNNREKLRFWLRFPGVWFSWGIWQPMISQAKRLYYAVRYR